MASHPITAFSGAALNNAASGFYRLCFSIGLASIFIFSHTAAAEAPAKAAQCAACHGQDGGKTIMPNYPKIKGQNKAYIVDSLKAYKNGSRKGGNAAIMIGQSASLTNAEIEALADYYSKQ